MTERSFIRGLGCRPNGRGMSADIRYRSAGMARAIAARVPGHELEDRGSAAPAIGLDRLEQDLESLRARHRTAHLSPHIVVDDFLVPAATERAVKGFSVLHSQQRNNSCTPMSSRFRPNPIRRGSSAS
jgi:hypothetical protein